MELCIRKAECTGENMKINLDIINTRAVFHLSVEELAKILGVRPSLLVKWQTDPVEAPAIYAEKLHEYAHKRNFSLNDMEIKIYYTVLEEETQVISLFHAVEKRRLRFPRKVLRPLEEGDEPGFLSFVTDYPTAALLSSLHHCPYWYATKLCTAGLTMEKFAIDLDFLLERSRLKGWLGDKERHGRVTKIERRVKRADVLSVPLTDASMDNLIFRFAEGEITDEQCIHALQGYSLGMRYMIMTQKGRDALSKIREYYSSKSEIDDYQKHRESLLAEARKKARLARIEFRGKGKYIDEILN